MSTPDQAAKCALQQQKNFVPYDVMICDSKGVYIKTLMLSKTSERLAHTRLPTLFGSVQSALDYFNPSPLNCIGKVSRAEQNARLSP